MNVLAFCSTECNRILQAVSTNMSKATTQCFCFDTQVCSEHLTFILGGELPHLWGEALVELVLPGDEGLADCLLPKS